MILNGVELSQRELQSLRLSVDEAVYHWIAHEQAAFTDAYRTQCRDRRVDLERIAKLLRWTTECTATTAGQ